MKGKTHNRFAAVFLALVMMLTSVSISMFIGLNADAAAGTYTFVAGEATGDKAFEKSTENNGRQVKLTDYFTLYCNDKTALNDAKGKNNTSNKTFNGVTLTGRLNFGGKSTFDKDNGHQNLIKFTTKAAAAVDVYMVQGGNKEDKPVNHVIIYDETGAKAASSEDDTKLANMANNDPYIVTLKVPAKGTYYLGNTNGNNYYFKVEVTEEASEEPAVKPEAKVFDVSDPAVKAKLDGTTNKISFDYFTLAVKENANAVVKTKELDFDGTKYSSYVSFGGGYSNKGRCVSFTTTENKATIKIWWATGNTGRYPIVYESDGATVAKEFKMDSAKDTGYVSTVGVEKDGTYYIGGSGDFYIYRVEVTEGVLPEIVLTPWADVVAPVLAAPTVSGDTISVSATADVNSAGGEKLVVEMLKNGDVIDSKSAYSSNPTVEFKPTSSETYTFIATLSREGEDSVKKSAEVSCEFLLPLAAPTVNATSKGKGTIELAWTAVPEAEHYVISYGDQTITTENNNTVYTVTGLKVGETYEFTVKAVRGTEESPTSEPVSVEATAEAVVSWDFVYYGTSTGKEKNKYEINEDDGSVKVIATGNGGKIQYENKFDGLGFYYTRVSAADNFTLKAKVKVDEASVGSQTGFGLLALDSYPTKPNSTAEFYTNQFMAGAYKFHYYWDFENNEIPYDDSGTKYTMQHGIGVSRRFGITDSTGDGFKNQSFPLELSAVKPENESGIYQFEYGDNSEFIFEIGRNNTGYYAAYYTPDGKLVGKQQFYDPEALSVLDKNSVYVGFFTGRVSTATFSVIDFKTWSKAEDKTPAEKQPITLVTPNIKINSAAVANSSDYTLMMTPNVKGTISVSLNGVEESEKITADKPKTLYKKNLTLVPGKNEITVTFTPLPTADQDFEYDYIQLRSEAAATSSITVNYDTDFANQKNLYISPDGKATGNGGPEYPLDIYTAVKVAQPGQTIVVMEGTYNLSETVTIERGVDGEANNPIRMIADPEAKSRPVFDFGKVGGGIRHGGNYWYFSGFDVTRTANKASGFRVCGSNNTLDRINTYANGNAGVQISAFRDSSDPKDMWPKDNLILNCNSYDNADDDGNDADGFAAKLTCGDGNVFDGCAAYNNCDDGWDLFAKPTTGEIGSVTIKNCIAYNNGHNISGSIKGDGNGFKLGGSNMAGKHVLENSFAFNNDANGITSNSGTGVTVNNCTSYNNKGAGLTMYSGNKTIEYTVNGVVVCGNSSSVADNTNDKDNQIRKVTSVEENAFVSTEFGGLKRKDNGSLDLGDFLKLKETTSGGADFDKEGGSTPSEDIDPIVPDKDLPDPKPDTPDTPDNPGSSSGAVGTVTNPSTSDKDDVEFEHSDTNIKVTAPAGAFEKPDEIKFNVVPVVEETKDNQFTFDLTFTDKAGNKVQPKTAVTVKIPVPEALKGKTIYVYHVENDGKYTEISCKVEDGMVVFSATSFSKYIITSEKLTASEPTTSDTSGESKPTDSSASGSGSTGDGNSNNPSTGAAVPFTSAAVVIVGAAVTIFITKRKRG